MSKKYPDQEIEIYDIEFPNKGIGTWEGSKVTIKNTLPGQTVLTDVKRKRRQLEGRLRGIIKKADYEIEPACPRFGLCGGCTYQNISYEKQLEIKQKTVKDLLDNAENKLFQVSENNLRRSYNSMQDLVNKAKPRYGGLPQQNGVQLWRQRRGGRA